ncbi:hypothetical protein DICVIV_06300, partial [Dictyocaulus viviparus]
MKFNQNDLDEKANEKSGNSFPNISTYLASDTNFLKAAEIITTFAYGECSNDNDKEIQCDLLKEDGGLEIDPNRLDFKGRIRWHLREFCYKTSSHGIPMLGQAPNMIYRCFLIQKYEDVHRDILSCVFRIVWIILLSGCAFTFIYEAIAVVDKYYRMDKITDIQLKFDTAPFPAITLCNLNPYRDSGIRDEESVNKILNVFNMVMKMAANAGDLDELSKMKITAIGIGNSAKKRNVDDIGTIEPANSVCICEDGECEAEPDKVPTKDDTECICAFDRIS